MLEAHAHAISVAAEAVPARKATRRQYDRDRDFATAGSEALHSKRLQSGLTESRMSQAVGRRLGGKSLNLGKDR